MLGKGVLESCYRRNRAWFNIIFMPYALAKDKFCADSKPLWEFQ